MPRSFGTTNVALRNAAPPVGFVGETYFNTTEDQLYVSNGTAWIVASGGGGGGATEVYVGTSPPVPRGAHLLWINPEAQGGGGNGGGGGGGATGIDLQTVSTTISTSDTVNWTQLFAFPVVAGKVYALEAVLRARATITSANFHISFYDIPLSVWFVRVQHQAENGSAVTNANPSTSADTPSASAGWVNFSSGATAGMGQMVVLNGFWLPHESGVARFGFRTGTAGTDPERRIAAGSWMRFMGQP